MDSSACSGTVSYTHLDVYKRQAYNQMYCVYEKESGLFLGTGYYNEEEKTLKADKIFVTR